MARRHGDAWTSEIARLVGQLRELVEAEEPLLARADRASAVAWIRDDLDCLDCAIELEEELIASRLLG